MKRAAWILALAACRPAPTPPPSPKPAAVLSREGDLVIVSLTDAAEKRLGLKTAPIEKKRIAPVRELGGDIIVPPGASAVVSAPIAGTLGGDLPRAGSAVKKGATLFTLTPFLSPESRASLSASRVEAAGAAEGARVRAAAAKVELDRAERLLGEGAGSRRAVDESRARLRGAEADFEASVAKGDLLKAAVEGSAAPFPLTAPLNGVLWKIHAAPGQVVPAGTPLFEVVRLDILWIRVPVYVGELTQFDATLSVTFDGRKATPVAAPAGADPVAATADLVYEVENVPHLMRPGQKITASIPLRAPTEAATLPAAAILYDMHGGTWVYEQVAPLRYARRRVRVRHVDGPLAVLEGDLKIGTTVVVEGAAELFGTEFYVSK